MALTVPVFAVIFAVALTYAQIAAGAPPATPFGAAEEHLRVWSEPMQRKLEIPILNGLYVLPQRYGAVLTSRDGENFTLRTSDTPLDLESIAGNTRHDLISVAYGNGVYVAGGGEILVRSLDGEDWKAEPSPGYTPQVHFGNGRFLAGSGSKWWISTDGAAWTPVALPQYISAETMDAGPRGFLLLDSNRNPWFSEDAVSWKVAGPFPDAPYAKVVAAGDQFFVIPNGNLIYSSRDGTKWNSSVVHPVENINFPIRHVVFKDGLYYYIGRWVTGGDLVVSTSVDGQNWKMLPDPVAALGPFPEGQWKGGIRKLLPFGDRLIAFGTQKDPVLISRDATNTSIFVYEAQRGWNNVSPTNQFVPAAGASSDSVALLVGSGGKMLRSTNGSTWTEFQPGGSGAWNDIVRAGGEFFAVGDNGRTLRSADAVAWVAGSIPGPEHLISVAYGNGTYVALGGVGTPNLNYRFSAIFTSTNGIAWQKIPGIEGHLLRSVVYQNGHFLAARWIGNYLTSRDGFSWEAPGHAALANHFKVEQADTFRGWFFLYGPHGANWYRRTLPVIVSSDLYNWSELGIPGGDIAEFGGSAWVGHPAFIFKLPFNGPPTTVSLSWGGNLSENGQTGGVTAARQGPLRLPMQIPLALSGEALPGEDYSRVASANFAVGEATADVSLEAFPDALDEPTETLHVTLRATDHFNIDGPETVTLRLFDKSATPRFRSVAAPIAGGNFSAIAELDPSSAHSLWASSNLIDWTLIRHYPAGSVVRHLDEIVPEGRIFLRFMRED